MSTAMITQTKLFLEKKTPDLIRWSRGGVQATAITMLALQELTNNPAIRDATPQSVYCALLACAISGLEPGSLKQEAFLVPFKRRLPNSDQWITEVKFLCGWRGIVKQATRAGGILWIRSAVVHEGDAFDLNLSSDRPIDHRPRIGTARGAIAGAWAMAKLTNGEYQAEWLDIERLTLIRNFANAKKPSPAWDQWPEEMYRKSAVRALGKYLPMDETYFNAARLEHAQEAESGPTDLEVLDMMTEGAASADAADGGPIAGFVAAQSAFGHAADRTTTRGKDKTAPPPIDAQAMEVRPTTAPSSPPSSPTSPASSIPSSSASSHSPTTGSTSPASSPPPAISSSASTTSAPPSPPAPDADEDAGQGNERPEDADEEEDADRPAFDAPAAPAQILGHPTTLEGFEAWVRTCKQKQALREGMVQWRDWARDIAGFDPGYTPKTKDDPIPVRPMSREIARMTEAFTKQWAVAR